MKIPLPSPNGTNYECLYLNNSPTHAFDGKYGLVTDEHRTPPAFDAAAFGRECTAKALRAQGLAMDQSEGEPEEKTNSYEWDEDLCSAGEVCFGKDKWRSFKKSYDALRKGEPKTGAEDAMTPGSLAEANYLRRYPNSFRIGRDDGYGRPVRPEPSRTMSAKETADYYSRFPGAARFKVR